MAIHDDVDACCRTSLHHDALEVCAGLDKQVRAVAHRFDIGDVRGLAPPALDVVLEKADAVVQLAIDVGGSWDAKSNRGLDEIHRAGVAYYWVTDPDGPSRPA